MFIIFRAKGKSEVKGYGEEKEVGIYTRFLDIVGKFHRINK